MLLYEMVVSFDFNIGYLHLSEAVLFLLHVEGVKFNADIVQILEVSLSFFDVI